jgi:hypothetical protein
MGVTESESELDCSEFVKSEKLIAAAQKRLG